ncbi:hypothetical protein AB0M36_05590 [Actinoplanes sp. NPDC051346]|uniref:hypothetical protein n=1 Tax=Actinoplanes sp. NPDC051346 TaxID=3155048 RepID=UPI0034377385
MPDGDDVTTPAAGSVAPAFVPLQRSPHPAETPFDMPFVPPSGLPDLLPERSRFNWRRWAGGLFALATVVAVLGSAVYVTVHGPFDAPEEPTASRPLTPTESVRAALDLQAQALLSGDEKAWLAVVDPKLPKLQARYRTMFRSLRTLGVSHFDYLVDSGYAADDNAVKVDAEITYCFVGDKCGAAGAPDTDGMPVAFHELVLTPRDGKMLITSLVSKKSGDWTLLPAPWEDSELVAVQGKRVTLLATPGERKHLKRLLPIAERAAAVADRFAGLVANPQQRYRIYLAGPRQWKTWYGGQRGSWTVAYTQTLVRSTTDVVLNMAELKNEPDLLATTIQHELAHVVTVGGLNQSGSGSSGMWLEEGIAEYIGWHPNLATASWRRPSVRDAVHGTDRPESIALHALADDADDDESDAFYGLGHFAASCLAEKYGEKALFTFVRLYLREDSDLDRASEEAFSKPFKSVDNACLTWIRDRA